MSTHEGQIGTTHFSAPVVALQYQGILRVCVPIWEALLCGDYALFS
jgi:hypothetical protein